ncbi:hypothetical protein MIT9_P1846 [Methylomarinovum caldicuralii]|uniref:Membrane protein involved in the export of O-antigen and teichoic acid n=1 Tax=Methylomarinovum caldicuralii TaxID=438856 RepID=A0AAU9C4X7_9GAMM|nr:oligosaccharide flippase family protein [Methylomarinovum caldicuralii]BCX82260.1 hypothetical protein MIT9_P1846 [Methylomarinovum caldicuralii]
MSATLARNATANVLQMVISAVLLFALYRYISDRLGIAALGVWSVVIATASATRLSDLGLSAAVTRFVARSLARAELDEAAQVVEVAFLSLLAVLTLLLPSLYQPLFWLMQHLFEDAHLLQARALMPYGLVSLGLAMLAAVFQSGLDGCQRMDLRAGMVILGQGLMVGLAVWLIPRYGLMGLAWAQIGQGLFLLVIGWLLLRRTLPKTPWIPCRWSWRQLRGMLAYGVNVQIAGVFILLFDPLTKALMVRFGGSEAVGYFEMANQVVLKVRSLIMAANRAVVPKVAEIVERSPEHMREFYRQNMRALAFVAIPVFALLDVWSGGVSWLLLGRLEPQFLLLLQVSIGGWFANLFNGPAYFANLGSGRVGWNTVSHVTMGILNGLLGWWLGLWYGAAGVALAYATALVLGSWLLVFAYQIRAGIRLHSMGFEGSGGLAGAGLIAVAAAHLAWNRTDDVWVRFSVLLAASLLLTAVAWRHPVRGFLWRRFAPARAIREL